MIDIVDAIRALDPNAWVGCSNNDINQIHWHDGNPKKFTKDQIQVKYDELVEEHKKNQYQRDRAESYPELKEQLDLLWHAIDGGKFNVKSKETDFYKKLKAVKDANPKPE